MSSSTQHCYHLQSSSLRWMYIYFEPCNYAGKLQLETSLAPRLCSLGWFWQYQNDKISNRFRSWGIKTVTQIEIRKIRSPRTTGVCLGRDGCATGDIMVEHPSAHHVWSAAKHPVSELFKNRNKYSVNDLTSVKKANYHRLDLVIWALWVIFTLLCFSPSNYA